MPVTVEPLQQIQGVHLVHFQKFGDGRGYFYESYRREWIPGAREMVQGNCSFSQAGVLRGLHYHLKQADLWGVPVGRARAALYDFRPSSRTFRASHVVDMGAQAAIGLYIPKGVAHGFLAVEDCYMTYMVDEYYDGTDEYGVRWDDATLGIDWGAKQPPVLSPRDAANPLLELIAPERRPR